MQAAIVPHVHVPVICNMQLQLLVVGGGEFVHEIAISAIGGGQVVIAAAITIGIIVAIATGVDGMPAAVCERGEPFAPHGKNRGKCKSTACNST